MMAGQFVQQPLNKGLLMPSWIDFKELREALSFEAVLRHYGVELRVKDGQHLGFCPLPSHDGKRKSPSFSANMDRKIFHCFGCQAKGNILDFAALMEKADPKDGRALKRIAVELRTRFCSEPPGERRKKSDDGANNPQLELPSITNQPLDFELQGLDPRHPYLANRGFTEATALHFGIGFCARGSLSGRIAIPLLDSNGSLIGYAGRVIDDTAITDDHPRYRFPAAREHDGKRLAFKKTLFLYNGFSVAEPVDHLGVVQGFPSVWWLHQHGYPHAVATMGSECSDEQAELMVTMVKPRGHVWIIPDGDRAGEKFAQSLLAKISPHRFVRWVRLESGRQPTDLAPAEMKACFGR